jgi:long-chain acyl-CoA synthetase
MTNVVEQIWRFAESTPAKIAVRQDEHEWTYADLRAESARVAAVLRDRGVRPGDRVVLVQGTTSTFLAGYCGVLEVGAAVVLVNVMATAAEIRHILTDADVKVVLAGSACTGSAQEAARPLGLPTYVLEDISVGSAVPLRAPVSRGEDDPAMLLYTSGTTGKPKGVVISHGSLFAAPDSIGDVVSLTADDVVVTALPLFHVFGGVIVSGMTLTTGATLSLIERFKPQKVLDVLVRDDATVYAGVPTMHNALVNHEGGGGAEQFASLRVCISGGAPLPGEIHEAFMQRYGAKLLEGYGMTEMTGVVSFTRPELDLPPGTVGVPTRGVEMKVLRADGTDAQPGDVGELYCRGANLMLGYNNLPEATADALTDGWYASGDLVTRDEHGVITIVGRLKELIIRGGYNVYPREVEEVLLEHPDILDVAVVGVDDRHYGQEVAAVIVPRAGAVLDPDVLRLWAKERLSAYKVPHIFGFVDELPKGPSGKISKKDIDLTNHAIRKVATA